MSRFGNDLLQISPKGEDTVFSILGLGDFSVLSNAQLQRPQSGGAYGLPPSQVFRAPTIPFSTEDIETVIDEITPVNGICYEDGTGVVGLQAWQGRRDSCSVDGREADTAIQWTSNQGHVLVSSVNGSDTGNVTAQLIAHALSTDGEAAAISKVFNGTIPSVAASETIWKLAGVVLNGTYIKELRSVNISYNHSIAKPVEGNIVASEIDWQQAIPSVSLTIGNPEKVWGASNLNLQEDGMRINSSNSYVQFRKSNSADGGMADPGLNIHIRCGLNGLLHSPTRSQASGVASATTQLEVATAENATGNPLIWQTLQTLTTS